MKDEGGRRKIHPSSFILHPCHLPDGFELVQSGRCTAAVRSVARAEVLALGVLDEAAFGTVLSRGRRLGGGRGAAVSVPFGPGGERAVVRRCRRGGLLGRLLGGRYLGSARPMREISVSEAARAAGVPTPECLAAVVRRRGPFCFLDLISREIPDAISLEEWLRRNANAPAGAASDVGSAVADAFLRLVQAGIYHPDLHAGNVLIQARDGRPLAHIIDLDKATRLPELPDRLTRKMLFRFNRALVKRGLAPQPVTLSARVRFCMQLGIAIGPGEMRRLVRQCGTHLRRHSWRY
jgi:hypothetical protein